MAAAAHLGERKGTAVWYAESPDVIAEFVLQGFGWAELPFSVVSAHIQNGALSPLNYAFQQSDILEGIDVVWTEQQGLGVAAHWVKGTLPNLPQEVWREV